MPKCSQAILNGMISAMTLILPSLGPVLAEEPPPLKEGLWSIHSHDVEHPSNKTTDFTSTLCRSHASDQQARENSKSTKSCTTVKENLAANRYSVETRCEVGGTTIESKSTTLFLGNSTHTVVHVTYTPALKGVTQSTLTQDQRYIGACPVGAEAGDVMLPNGSVQHLGRASDAARPQP